MKERNGGNEIERKKAMRFEGGCRDLFSFFLSSLLSFDSYDDDSDQLREMIGMTEM